MPALTTNADDNNSIDDAVELVNGSIDLRMTHPNLYRQILCLSVMFIALGFNFYAFNPTFQVYHLPNPVWGTIWLALGLTTVFFLHVRRRLQGVRIAMAFAFSFILFFALGTTEPWIDGEGSLQLPLLYLGLAMIHLPLLTEPFLNPWTARR